MKFYKYQGTGNDFVIIDNRIQQLKFSEEEVALLCHRKFGIGADGFILLELSKDYDFKMVYYNSDGNVSSMCGNGGRCISHFAWQLGLIKHKKGVFEAIDGLHEFKILMDDTIQLKMNDVLEIVDLEDALIMDTGSPHYITFCDDLLELDIIKEARDIRYNDRFREEGINVNFVEKQNNLFYMRTYERGVEDETLSCGTGTIAAALTLAKKGMMTESPIELNTPGGKLKVHFNKIDEGFSDIWLEGQAKLVFSGKM